VSYLSRLHEEAQKRADAEPVKGAKAPFAPLAGSEGGRFRGIPADAAQGLHRLGAARCPPITRPAVWPEIVADALRLIDEGWATQALALGWLPLHLWGCSPEKGGNEAQDGLAVVLAGRRIILLDDRSAIIESGAGTRRVFSVRPMTGAILLWELSNGRTAR
jgi:hypothetical protein